MLLDTVLVLATLLCGLVAGLLVAFVVVVLNNGIQLTALRGA